MRRYIKGMTFWVVADAGTEEGAKLIAAAFAFLDSSATTAADSRVGVVHPPAGAYTRSR